MVSLTGFLECHSVNRDSDARHRFVGAGRAAVRWRLRYLDCQRLG